MTRSIITLAALAALALCSTASTARAEIYRWVDETGQMHLVSDLNEVPAKYRDAAVAASKREGGTLNIIEGMDEQAPRPEVASPESAEPSPAPAAPAEVEVVEDANDGGYYDDRRERERARHQRAEAARGEEEIAPGQEGNANHPPEPLPDHRRRGHPHR